MQSVTSRDGTGIAFDRSGKGSSVIFVGPSLAARTAGAPLTAQLAKHVTSRRSTTTGGVAVPVAIPRRTPSNAKWRTSRRLEP